MSHDFYIPDFINGPKDPSTDFPIALCRKCGEWRPNAIQICPSSTQQAAAGNYLNFIPRAIFKSIFYFFSINVT